MELRFGAHALCNVIVILLCWPHLILHNPCTIQLPVSRSCCNSLGVVEDWIKCFKTGPSAAFANCQSTRSRCVMRRTYIENAGCNPVPSLLFKRILVFSLQLEKGSYIVRLYQFLLSTAESKRSHTIPWIWCPVYGPTVLKKSMLWREQGREVIVFIANHSPWKSHSEAHNVLQFHNLLPKNKKSHVYRMSCDHNINIHLNIKLYHTISHGYLYLESINVTAAVVCFLPKRILDKGILPRNGANLFCVLTFLKSFLVCWEPTCTLRGHSIGFPASLLL